MEDRGEEEGIKQQQENQERPSKSENPLHQPQPPQKCPRCDSLNTKFCYYNNYSLSQPRYFCKTCRRYWTQGGTLRNVPVGGGFRKAKRSQASSSSGTDNSRSKQPPPPPLSSLQLQHQQQQVQVPRNLAALSTMVPASANSILQITSSIPHHYYSDGGFLSSLAAVQSFSQPPSITNQAINAGDHQYVGGGGDDLLQGRNVQTLGSQQTQPHHHQFHQIGSRDKNTEQMYPFDQNMVQPSRTVGSWTHNFWSNSNTSNATNSSITPGNSSEPNQWPNLPDYGPPHP